MRQLLRDVGLSFCPASVRSLHPPSSSSQVLLAAVLTGAIQSVIFSRWFFVGYFSFLALRGEQLAPAVERMNQTTQAWFAGVLTIEYLIFHPVGLLTLYLALEGFIRFAGGVCVSEVVASLPVAVTFRIKKYIKARTKIAQQSRIAVPDSVEVLAEGARLRVAACLAKPSWKPSLTIGINGEWYELEGEERGTPPRLYVYTLRRAPIGKILRAYEEYDLAAAKTTRESKEATSF